MRGVRRRRWPGCRGGRRRTEPEAELWIGAHPQAPSAVTMAGRRKSALDRLVAERPAETLGLGWRSRFGPDAAVPAQGAGRGRAAVDPGPSFARAGGGGVRPRASETGIAPDAPNRDYRDRNHKPEVAVALEPYWMMSGFRSYAELVRHLEAVGVPELRDGDCRAAPAGRQNERWARCLATALQLNDRQRVGTWYRAPWRYAASQLRAADRGIQRRGHGTAIRCVDRGRGGGALGGTVGCQLSRGCRRTQPRIC